MIDVDVDIDIDVLQAQQSLLKDTYTFAVNKVILLYLFHLHLAPVDPRYQSIPGPVLLAPFITIVIFPTHPPVHSIPLL